MGGVLDGNSTWKKVLFRNRLSFPLSRIKRAMNWSNRPQNLSIGRPERIPTTKINFEINFNQTNFLWNQKVRLQLWRTEIQKSFSSRLLSSSILFLSLCVLLCARHSCQATVDLISFTTVLGWSTVEEQSESHTGKKLYTCPTFAQCRSFN